MKMNSLFSASFSNGDRMIGTLYQIYAAQEINNSSVAVSPYITIGKAQAPTANEDGTMTGYALFVPELPYTGKLQQITGTFQRLSDAAKARNALEAFDDVEFFAKYQRTF